MNYPPNLGMILLAIWLILFGAVQALRLSFDYSYLVIGILAIVSGILLLMRR